MAIQNFSTALITGAGNGIGLALAEQLAANGTRVALTDVDLAAAKAGAARINAAGGHAAAWALDVLQDAQWTTVVSAVEDTLGPIDLLCSNAGSSSSLQTLTDLSVEYLKWLLDVNVLGAVRAVRAVVPGMQQRGRGHVLFTGSMGSLWVGPGQADYGATKHALLAIADTLRMELAGTDVAVSLLCPAAVATQLGETTKSLSPSSDSSYKRYEYSEDDIAALVAETGGVLSAEVVAMAALKGIQRGDFYIFTHHGAGARFLVRSMEIEKALVALG